LINMMDLRIVVGAMNIARTHPGYPTNPPWWLAPCGRRRAMDLLRIGPAAPRSPPAFNSNVTRVA